MGKMYYVKDKVLTQDTAIERIKALTSVHCFGEYLVNNRSKINADGFNTDFFWAPESNIYLRDIGDLLNTTFDLVNKLGHEKLQEVVLNISVDQRMLEQKGLSFLKPNDKELKISVAREYDKKKNLQVYSFTAMHMTVGNYEEGIFDSWYSSIDMVLRQAIPDLPARD